MEMIDQLQINHKVTNLVVRLRKDNPIDCQLIQTIANKCNNLYTIEIYDHSESIDMAVHNSI